jgi:hypothetical protein
MCYPVHQLLPAARRTRKPGRFLHSTLARCVQQPVGCVNRATRRFRQLARRGNRAGSSIQLFAGCIQRSIGYITRFIRCFRCLPGWRYQPLSPSGAPPDASNGRWMRQPDRRMHPAARRTRKSTGLSVRSFVGRVQRTARSIRQLAGPGNQPVSPSGALLDASNDRWMRHPDRWMHPAARRTRKPAGLSIRRFAGCVQRLVGCFQRGAESSFIGLLPI